MTGFSRPDAAARPQPIRAKRKDKARSLSIYSQDLCAMLMLQLPADNTMTTGWLLSLFLDGLPAPGIKRAL